MNKSAYKIYSKSRSFTIERLWLYSFILILVAHFSLTYNRLYSNASIFGSIALCIAIIYVSRIYENIPLKTLIIFIGCYFNSFIPGSNGFFVILAFFIFLPDIIERLPKDKNPPILLLFISIILITSILGWVFKLPIKDLNILLGFISLSAYLLVFYSFSNVKLSFYYVRSFIHILCVLSILNLFVSINTHFGLIPLESPLFISSLTRLGMSSWFMSGTFTSSELYGEYFLLVYLFLLVILLSFGNLKKVFGFNFKLITFGLITAGLNSFFSFSKAVFLLLLIGTTLIILSTKQSSKSYFRIIFIISISASIYYLTNRYIEYGFIVERINENPEMFGNFIDDPLTGKGTSRETAYSLGIERIKSEQWWLGYGWSTPRINKVAWFGGGLEKWIELRADHHNLYLCLVPVFGWFGSISYVGILLFTLFRIAKFLINSNNKRYPIYYIIKGSLFFILFFIIDEYKIPAIRSSSYFMIIWIWLAFVNALLNSKAFLFLNHDSSKK